MSEHEGHTRFFAMISRSMHCYMLRLLLDKLFGLLRPQGKAPFVFARRNIWYLNF